LEDKTAVQQTSKLPKAAEKSCEPQKEETVGLCDDVAVLACDSVHFYVDTNVSDKYVAILNPEGGGFIFTALTGANIM
jgi:hypothetical protein